MAGSGPSPFCAPNNLARTGFILAGQIKPAGNFILGVTTSSAPNPRDNGGGTITDKDSDSKRFTAGE
jgi:hypothetical protein